MIEKYKTGATFRWSTSSSSCGWLAMPDPLATSPTTATTLLGYRSNRVSIPDSAAVTSVRQRVTFPAPLPNTVSIN